jgi:aminoglycoside phosphotransferase family enzyme
VTRASQTDDASTSASNGGGAGDPRLDLQTKVRFLSDRSAYAGGTSSVETIETHFACVFLTDLHAYKLKKPIRFDRLDLSTLVARRRDCDDELRLNRRLAAGVYLGVVPLSARSDGSLVLEGDGTPVDWLVKMVKLPSGLMLDRALTHGHVTSSDVRPVALHLAHFYGVQPALGLDGAAYRQRLARRVAENREALCAPDLALPRDRVHALASRLLLALDGMRAAVEARSSRVIEGHGDLRPEHVCLCTPPCVIDCLEFDLDLRIVDPVEELAFLGLECARLGAPWMTPLLIDIYASETHDEVPPTLVRLYTSLRAFNRAKIVAWHLRDPAVSERQDWRAAALDYVDDAEAALALAGSSHAAR